MLKDCSAIKAFDAEALSCRYSMPGKALLFGEYGLLLGLPGVAVTFSDFRVEVSCTVQGTDTSPVIRVHSAFLKEKILIVDSFEGADFFQGVLAPYEDVLIKLRKNKKDLTIAVEKSFPPHLGFGSSSALLASIHAFLFGYLCNDPPLASSLFFQRLRESLNRIQGTGSGYDATLQLAAKDLSSPQLWMYKRTHDAVLPEFCPITVQHAPQEHVHFGTILGTYLYAETKAALKKFSEEKCFSHARAHGALAESFLKDPNVAHLSPLIAQAHSIQQQQGILPDMDLIQNLRQENIPFKSLGAGFGDCLWSPWKACQLQAFQDHIITEIILP
ncbi:MAG: hypothetical protein LBH38_02295 [Holosporales bacterium]|jgi:mevalonate kinase|nr:hypothetical protein [Holosporales bacterium]